MDTTHTRSAGRGLLVLALLAAAACGGSGASEPAPGPSPEALSTAELEALYRARTDSARMRYTEADVAFMTAMIAHHAQALVMAALVPERTTDRQIRTLAARITNAQADEIATMQRWLRDRGEPVPEVHIEGTTLMVHGAHHDAHMPGMLTPEQLRELEAARGDAFDRLFLRRMIEHHQGAVTMVRTLFATDAAAQDEDAFRLATDVHVDQITEIDRMKRMLDALTDGETP